MSQESGVRSQETGSAGAAPGADLFESAFDSLPCAVLVFDRRLAVTLRNRAAKDLLPDLPELPDALARLAVESNYGNWRTELRKVIEKGSPRSFDLRVRTQPLRATEAGARKAVPHKDQPEVFLQIMVNPLRSPATGETIGGLLIAEDISSRISMERRLAVSERLAAVGKLAARVAHELNNPLDGILRFINLAIRRLTAEGAGVPPAQESGVRRQKTEDRRQKLGGCATSDPRIVEYLEGARTGGIRMRDIVSSLLEFSRTAPNGFEQATINKIVEDAVSSLEGRAQESNVTVVCNFHQSDMPVVRGSSLFQVFCNLLKNAIDAMSDGGTVTITTQLSGPDVVVIFEDNGIGLPDEIGRIFEPFYTTKASGKGTGLGLAVSKELIEKYSGTISARRRQPKGSIFTVTIPVRNCAASPLGRTGFLSSAGESAP